MKTLPTPEQHQVPHGTPQATPYAAGYGAVAPYGAPAATLQLRRLLPMLWEKWWLLALALLVAGTAAICYLRTTPKVYRATSLLELTIRRPRILAQQAAVIEDTATSPSEEIFNTRIERFKARSMMLAALAAFEAQEDVPAGTGARDAASLDERLRRYQSGLTLNLMRRSHLIRVEFEHTSPTVAAAACNAFGAAAEARAHSENRSKSDAAVVWLESQAEVQRKELAKCDDALLAFRKEHKLDVLESQRKTAEAAVQEHNKALVDLESREAMDQEMLATLSRLDLNPEKAGQLPAEIPRATDVSAALERWSVAVTERNGLLTRYTPEHPEVKTRDRLIELYRTQAVEAIAMARATAMANRDLHAKQADSLRQKKKEQAEQQAGFEQRVLEVTTRLASLERARDAADQSYRGVLARIQEARMAADEDTATVSVVEAASVPTRPVKPGPVRVVVLALLLGLLAGVGLVMAAHSIEDRLSPEELDNAGLPVVAVVPHVSAKGRSEVATAMIDGQFSQIAEGYAGLRAMLDSPQHKGVSKVVMVASSLPGEGKTVTSCNLAAAWAKMGRRVLLIDCDLRRPQLAKIFSMPAGHTGLLEALHKRLPLSALTQLPFPAPGCPALHVLVSQPFGDAHPAEIVGRPDLAQLLAWARETYDHVVLDVPPLGLMSDALTLAPMTDMTLIMVRPGISRKRLTWHTVKRLRDAGIHRLSFVVNDVDFSRTRYGAYNSYYGYARYYSAYGQLPAAS